MKGGYPRPAGRGRGRDDRTFVTWSLLLLLVLGCAGLVGFFRSGEPTAKPWKAASREEIQQIARRHRAARMGNGLVATAPLVASGKDVTSFPSAKDSTIMFLHVFKCAGTSLREVFMSLAEKNGWSGAIVSECKANSKALTQENRVCLNERNDLIDVATQRWQVAEKKILAGHFIWNFDQYVTPPHLIITTLRNPLELFVSSQQFKHREETQTLEQAAEFVARGMLSRLEFPDPTDIGFIRRFLDSGGANSYRPALVYTQRESSMMVSTATERLSSLWVVGVVEQYRGFIEVLKHLLDPSLEHPDVWESAVEVKNNGSPVKSRDVLASIEPELVREFNASVLGYQWQVYDVALQLWDARCREVLPPQDHATLCAVPERRVY